MGKQGDRAMIKTFMPTDSYKLFKTTIANCTTTRENYCSVELELYTINGNLLTFHVSFSITYLDKKPFEIFGIARNITKDKLLQNQVLSKIIETEEHEKKIFAEELHDGLGSMISTMNIYVGMLMKNNKSQQQKTEYLNQLRKLANEAISNVRFFTNSLAPGVLNDFGLVAAIKLHCERINETYPELIVFKDPGIVNRFDRIIEINLYRIAVELINNSLKYAEASNINISINIKNKYIILQYQDNGKGFDIGKVLHSSISGNGIKNIFARVKSLEGTCDFNSKENEGVRFLFKVPNIRRN
jgi:signal transduction histidine kinase